MFDAPNTPPVVVAPQEPIVVPPPVASEPPAPKKRRGPLVAVVLIILLLLCGIGAGAYYYWQSLTSSENEIAAMVQAMEQVTSVALHITGQAEGAIIDETVEKEGKGPLAVLLSVDINGTTSGEERMFEGSLQSEIEDVKNNPFTVSYRTTDEASYFNISSVPGLGAATDALAIMINRWVVFDPAMFGQGNILADVIARTNAVSALTPAERAGMKSIFFKNLSKIFVIDGERASENRAGVMTSRYSFTFNEGALLATLAEMESAYPGTVTVADQAKVAEMLSYVDAVTGEAWVGEADNLLHAVTLQGDFAPQSGAMAEKIHEPFAFSLTVDLSNFNSPVDVTAPEDAVTVLEIMTEAAAKEAENADEDEDGLTAKQETEYGTDPMMADTDGDGYSDGDEVESGYNPAGEGQL